MTAEVVTKQDQGLARLDVQALIQQAITGNAGVETLERLVALAKDIRAEQAREAWYAAMATFQAKCPPIFKTKRAHIPTRTGAGYGYNFAPLDEVMDVIQPVMGPLGLSVSWRNRQDGNTVLVSCRISHSYGHTEDSGEMGIPITSASDGMGANAAQRVGIAMTYAKRYTLLGIIGKAPEDDDDANGGGGERERPAESPAEMRDKIYVQINEAAEGKLSVEALDALWREHYPNTKRREATPAQLAEFLAKVRELAA